MIENMRSEIEIRIESLKNELDKLNQQFQYNLGEIKEYTIKYNKQTNNS